MRVTFRFGGAVHAVDLVREGAGWRAAVGGRSLAVALYGGPDSRTGLAAEIDGRPVRLVVACDGPRWWVALDGEVLVLEEADEDSRSGPAPRAPLEVVSPMPGRILRLLVSPGERVEAGQPVVSVEAMKMEHALRAEAAGRVVRLLASAGERVEAGQLLVELTAEEA